MIPFQIPSKIASSLKTTVNQEYTSDHCKVAYMISLFGRSAAGPTEAETWIRQHPLWVYLFEGIVAVPLPTDSRTIVLGFAGP